jgi:hypothetical protein
VRSQDRVVAPAAILELSQEDMRVLAALALFLAGASTFAAGRARLMSLGERLNQASNVGHLRDTIGARPTAKPRLPGGCG